MDRCPAEVAASLRMPAKRKFRPKGKDGPACTGLLRAAEHCRSSRAGHTGDRRRFEQAACAHPLRAGPQAAPSPEHRAGMIAGGGGACGMGSVRERHLCGRRRLWPGYMPLLLCHAGPAVTVACTLNARLPVGARLGHGRGRRLPCRDGRVRDQVCLAGAGAARVRGRDAHGDGARAGRHGCILCHALRSGPA